MTDLIERAEACLDYILAGYSPGSKTRQAADVIRDLLAVVERLPRTADGVPVVPGREMWCINHLSFVGDPRGSIHSHAVQNINERGWCFGGDHFIPWSKCYSTRAAAERARAEQKGEPE